jgi:YggT family protein
VEFVVEILLMLLLVLQIALIGRALISWFDPRGANPISQFLYTLTEPIVAPIRSIMPRTGMFDFSIMVALILILVLRQMLTRIADGA